MAPTSVAVLVEKLAQSVVACAPEAVLVGVVLSLAVDAVVTEVVAAVTGLNTVYFSCR